MFGIFKKTFIKDTMLSVENIENVSYECEDVLEYFIKKFGGSSFDNGVYRVILSSDLDVWNARVTDAFPNFSNNITCFGFDWLGRVFAIDPNRSEDGQAGVVMFELGAGEALEIPCNIVSFHNDELIKYKDAALSSNFYQKWIKSNGGIPKYNQCIGYKIPLFLNGIDGVDNLELYNIDVYWEIIGKIYADIMKNNI